MREQVGMVLAEVESEREGVDTTSNGTLRFFSSSFSLPPPLDLCQNGCADLRKPIKAVKACPKIRRHLFTDFKQASRTAQLPKFSTFSIAVGCISGGSL